MKLLLICTIGDFLCSLGLHFIRPFDTLGSSVTFEWNMDKRQIDDEFLPVSVIQHGLSKVKHFHSPEQIKKSLFLSSHLFNDFF